MARYDVVTFDMGYTLVYFHPSELEIVLSAYHAVGLHPDPAALRVARDELWGDYFAQAGGKTFEPTPERDWELEETMVSRILERLGIQDRDLVPRIVLATEVAFSVPGVMRLYPEVEDVLRALRARGRRLGIISNWSWNLQDRVQEVGLSDYFDVVMASACTGCEKPHPAIFQQALEALHARPERALHIGDSYQSDVLGARGVGMDALWLDRQQKGGHPDCRSIHDLNEVLLLVTA